MQQSPSIPHVSCATITPHWPQSRPAGGRGGCHDFHGNGQEMKGGQQSKKPRPAPLFIASISWWSVLSSSWRRLLMREQIGKLGRSSSRGPGSKTKQGNFSLSPSSNEQKEEDDVMFTRAEMSSAITETKPNLIENWIDPRQRWLNLFTNSVNMDRIASDATNIIDQS